MAVSNLAENIWFSLQNGIFDLVIQILQEFEGNIKYCVMPIAVDYTFIKSFKMYRILKLI